MSQLDLFDALAESSAERTLVDLIAAGERPGPAHRERVVQAWRKVHGAYIVPSRSDHPWWLWELCITAPAGRGFTPDELDAWRADNPGLHVPTLLGVDRRNAHGEEPTGSPDEHLWYRAACLGCDFEGDPTIDENQATEDAHDHTHPWWRDLPVVEKPAGDAPAQVKKNRAKIAAVYEDARPGSTTEPWCPVRTWRSEGQTRHHTGGILGGYDLGVLRSAPC